MFTTTSSTAVRRTAARIAIAGAITVFPLAAVAAPAAADPATAPPGVTQVDRPHHGWDNPWEHDRKWDHDRKCGHDKWDDRKCDHDRNWDWDRGRGNDPLWRLLQQLLPSGSFGR
ncbi:hypothetical protein FEK35_28575 [Nocardia cyriacigeorgica]|uniref:Secreted protein n=1 Tax=Nocardia cyriacigeorgica TaxID=135487 RepID=A0A5R8P5H5_9NOCA|nr:hypothetical protein [Nocardia cyriacigeorgica]TLF94886.1 hypothetical protein FEK35_28575 [Nocardia cyriacigeorgica]